MRGSSCFTIAVCARTLFRAPPPAERVRRIEALGVAVEIWDRTRPDHAGLDATGARSSSMTRDTAGTLADDAGIDEILRRAAPFIARDRRWIGRAAASRTAARSPAPPPRVLMRLGETGTVGLEATIAIGGDLRARHRFRQGAKPSPEPAAA